MTTERKRTIAIIAGTLIVGILIGVLGSAIVARRYYHGERDVKGSRPGDRSSREDFAKRLMHIVQADSAQQNQMRPIVEETGIQIEAIQSHSRDEVQLAIDSMELKLQTVLRPDQLERLKDFNKKRKKEAGEGKRERHERD